MHLFSVPGDASLVRLAQANGGFSAPEPGERPFTAGLLPSGGLAAKIGPTPGPAHRPRVSS